MIDNGRFNGAKAYKDSKAGDLDQICRYWIDFRDNETIVFTPIFFWVCLNCPVNSILGFWSLSL